MNGLHLGGGGGGGGGSKQYRWKMVNHGRPVSCILLSSPLQFQANGRLAVHKGRAIGGYEGNERTRGKRKEERGIAADQALL
jgi:hypothetical protein